MLLQMSLEKHTWNYIIDLFFEPFNDFIELKKKKNIVQRWGFGKSQKDPWNKNV